MNYCVEFWGSHPDENNDDCFTGKHFDNFEEALEFGRRAVEGNIEYYWKSSTAAIRVVSEENEEIVKVFFTANVVGFTPQKEGRDYEWESEQRWESRMLYGEDIY